MTDSNFIPPRARGGTLARLPCGEVFRQAERHDESRVSFLVSAGDYNARSAKRKGAFKRDAFLRPPHLPRRGKDSMMGERLLVVKSDEMGRKGMGKERIYGEKDKNGGIFFARI